LLGITVHYVGLDGEPRAIAGAPLMLPTLPASRVPGDRRGRARRPPRR
jgi:hypothetical protein